MEIVMKIVFILIGSLLVIIAVIVVIGRLLPEKHMASRSVQLKASADMVWRTITDFKSSPQWRENLEKVDQVEVAPEVFGWKEVEKNGDAIVYLTTKAEPNVQLVRKIADKNLPYGGSWTFDLSQNSEGVMLSITENGEVYNPIFRFMSRFVFGHYATIDRYISQLSKFLESK
jgi:hypothetical protein